MFNRRFLRIKVFQQLYAYFQDEQKNRTAHEKNMLRSLDKAYELYIFLLSLAGEFHDFLGRELDIQQAKFYPSDEGIRSLRAFHENKAIAKLVGSTYMETHLKQYKLKWTNADELFRKLYQELKNNPFYNDYTSAESHTFIEDRKALNDIYQILIGDSELFNSYVEEMYMNWEDDQVVVTMMLLKSIDQIKENSQDEFISRASTSGEDIAFLKELFSLSVQKDEELTTLIASKTENWEPERIAVADMLMMKMALCEILYFPYIPVKVSINEYLELAKLYSTPNSHGFINGILDKIQLDLRKEQKIEKQGRGLVE